MLGDAARASFLDILGKVGLAEHGDPLLNEARECVHIFYQKPKSKLKVGRTKIGGLPDLPDSIGWPQGTDEEGKTSGWAQFLAQYNLADVPPINGLDLPRTGHLWLFIRNPMLISMPTAVFYHDGSEELAPRAKPVLKKKTEKEWREFKETALQFRPGISLPMSSKRFERELRERLNGKFSKLQEALAPGIDNYGPRQGIDGQIGGYSFQMEMDLCRELALEELGHPDYARSDCWSSVEQLEKQIKVGLPFVQDTRKQNAYRKSLKERLPELKWIVANEQKIQETADSFQLLSMIRPSMDIGLEFGDGMFMDFLIQRDALAKRDFSKTHCVCPMLL
jgi:hypothetical protein